jgi:hypothetical protein
MSGVTQDSGSGIYAPNTLAEWQQTLTFAGVTGNPGLLWRCQEASGNLADSIGSFTGTAGGAPTYQQAVAGWTRTGVGTAGGGTDTFSSTAAGLPDVDTGSSLLLAYISTPAAIAATHTIAQLGANFDDDTAAETNTSEQLVLSRDAANTAGTATFFDGTVRPLVLQVDRANNVSRIYTNQEVISGAAAGAGKKFLIGGDNTQSWTSAACTYLYVTGFFLTSAEKSQAQVKAILQALGWAIPW